MRSTQFLRQLVSINIKKFIPGKKSLSSHVRFSTFAKSTEEKNIFENDSMVKAYKKIDSIVSKEAAEAKKLNKILIILAGDQHGERASLALQSMLMHSANRNNIGHVLAEIPPGSSYQIDMFVNSDLYEEAPNLAFSLQLAKDKFGMKVTEADIDTSKISQTIEDIVFKRNDHFAKKCLSVKDNSLFLMGVGHIHGVLTHPELKDGNFHVVGFNLEGVSPKVESTDNPLMKKLHELAKPSRDASLISQILVPEYNWDSLDPKDIVQGVEKTALKTQEDNQSINSLRR